MRKALCFATASVLPFFLAGALLTSPTLTATYVGVSTRDEMTPLHDATIPDGAARLDDEDEGTADFLGNPVSAAVATYRLDATGSLYETHTPQIELPRLGSPKS